MLRIGLPCCSYGAPVNNELHTKKPLTIWVETRQTLALRNLIRMPPNRLMSEGWSTLTHQSKEALSLEEGSTTTGTTSAHFCPPVG